MVQLFLPGNGQAAGICCGEVLSVPYFELIGDTKEKANHAIQGLFTRVLNGFYRQQMQDRLSVELLWQSVATDNQTYQAQVKMYVLLRMLGEESSRDFISDFLDSLMRNLQEELSVHSYELRIFETEDAYLTLRQSLEGRSSDTVRAVAKKEQLFSLPLLGGASVYYNPKITPSEDVNTALITNALTQHPGSLISLQVIPTTHSETERTQVELTKSSLTYLMGQLRLMRGMHQDPTMQNLVEYYERAAAAGLEPCYYYNFLVYSDPLGANALGSRIIDQLEADTGDKGHAFELVDVTGQMQNPGAAFYVSPWVNSNDLVYRVREQSFWQSAQAPSYMQRVRYLLDARELASVFKLPLDDGTSIGLESRRTRRTREKLGGGILEKGSFRVGYLRNTSRDEATGELEAGIPLNDFTKHGLIVGMPGSGKTNFSLGMLLQFWKTFHIPFLAIEPTKSEYRALLDAIPELLVFTPGKGNLAPFIINPFIPPDNVTVETYAPALMTAFRAAFTMPSPLPNVFQNAINEAYTRYGWRKQSTSADPDVEMFGMYEFIRVFKDVASHLGYQGESKSNIESAGVLRLVSLIEQNSNIYDSIHTIPLQDLLSRPAVIELNAITDKEQKSLLMSFLLTMICVYTKNNMVGDGVLKNILLMDEAHVLLAGHSGSEEVSSVTIETVEDMIAEIRSYGTGVIIADQTPTKVGKNIVANTNVKVVFKLVEKDSRDMISGTTNMSPVEQEELARLGVGEAMLHFGRLHSPLQISTYNIEKLTPLRKVIPDRDVREKNHYWDAEATRKLLIPHRECRFSETCGEGCDLALRDHADYIAARILQEHGRVLSDAKSFVQFLVRMEPIIRAIAAQRSGLTVSVRLMNCVKIKFLRKALLQAPFHLSEQQWKQILGNSNFLNQAILPWTSCGNQGGETNGLSGNGGNENA